mmetsp:Transcript_26446/g.74878  ORF Transcript_26446/g.74878 Transcript_26446/m.74878 type:complete len:212 (+) Transcript_26446:2-637(+)
MKSVHSEKDGCAFKVWHHRAARVRVKGGNHINTRWSRPSDIPPANMQPTEMRLARLREERPVRPWPLVQPACTRAPTSSRAPPKKLVAWPAAPMPAMFERELASAVSAGQPLRVCEATTPRATPTPVRSWFSACELLRFLSRYGALLARSRSKRAAMLEATRTHADDMPSAPAVVRCMGNCSRPTMMPATAGSQATASSWSGSCGAGEASG